MFPIKPIILALALILAHSEQDGNVRGGRGFDSRPECFEFNQQEFEDGEV